MSKGSVLIVDDETDIRDLIAYNLKEAGISVSFAATGSEALKKLSSSPFSLVLLDIMMEDMDGFEVLRRMRAKLLDTPVILVSARHEDISKIHGLGLGADDYVTKPFSPQELVARVKAHIRRFRQMMSISESREPVTLEYCSIRLEPANQIVHIHEKPIQLTATESILLRALMTSPNRPLAKANLFRQVWGLHRFDENILNVAVNRLRQKIEDDPKNPRYIQTVWGLGYRFTEG